ncbi:MAG TPA: serine/threonine-protein kinase [Nitrospira sp.]|jgi:eukaryotic-like serine/threonine-protein kinase|nr:serine/threonine-protein kinase [Nitrospira sp.]
MSKSLHWILPHVSGILVALLLGPLVSSMAWVEYVNIPLTSISGANAVRFLSQGIAIGLVMAFAVSAYQQLPDNGRGSTFLRAIVLPLAAVVVLIFGGKTLRSLGLPLIHQIGTSLYVQGYTIVLLACGLWLTIAWLRHVEPLRNAFGPAPIQRKPARSTIAEESAELNMGEEIAAPTVDKSATIAMNGHVPAALGRYKILKELGRGAMGLVYLGKDPTIQRFVAIKTMRLDELDDPEKLQEIKGRFFREAESAGRLSHPNIVTIYDAGEQDELGYIAMELVEGRSLKHWSRKPNLMALPDVAQTLASVADTLDYAHQQGVVHRDIKPANIMITKDRLVKVMDFGIAKMASSSKTQTDVVLGTPTYMSPEQIAGKKVDGRSDVFSLGVVLFELLTGQPPFTADNLSALLFAIAHHPHPDLQSLRRDLPPMLQEVINRALQKELPQRYRRAGELAQDLRACLPGLAA